MLCLAASVCSLKQTWACISSWMAWIPRPAKMLPNISKRTKFWTSTKSVTNMLHCYIMLLKCVDFIWIQGSVHYCFGPSETNNKHVTSGKVTQLGGASSSSDIPKLNSQIASDRFVCCSNDWLNMMLHDLSFKWSDQSFGFTWPCCCLKALPSCMTAVEPSVMVRISTRDTRPQGREVCRTGPHGPHEVWPRFRRFYEVQKNVKQGFAWADGLTISYSNI